MFTGFCLNPEALNERNSGSSVFWSKCSKLTRNRFELALDPVGAGCPQDSRRDAGATENRELLLKRVASAAAEASTGKASAAISAESGAAGAGARRGGEGLARGV